MRRPEAERLRKHLFLVAEQGETMMSKRQAAGRRGRFETLEDRQVLSVTVADLQAAGISSRAINTITTSEYASTILADSTLENAIAAITATKTAPATATKITTVAGLYQMSAGTSSTPNIYLIEGDFAITNKIEVPSNTHVYVDGSIYKAGSHTRTAGQPSENDQDVIFRVTNKQNVKLIGVDNALLHSRATLNDQQGHATGVYVTGNQTNNVTVEGFEIANVWEGLVARGGPKNVVFSDNYVRDTLKRGIWHLTSQDSVAAHNFTENTGADGMDWDAFVDRSVGYENVVIAAGRWLGFVEEAAEDSAFIRNLGIMVDYGNPNADLYYQLGWVDHGTTSGVAAGGNFTQNNYFIDNVVFRPTGFREGGQYYANQPPKGDTWFWANRGYANGGGLNMNYFGELTNAEWLTAIPDRNLNFQPTVAGPGEVITPTEWLARLNEQFNGVEGLDLSSPLLEVSELAAVGTAIGAVTPLNAAVEDVTFEIVAGNLGGAFSIDEDGQITVAASLDFETRSTYSLTVEATDGERVGTATVSILVQSPFVSVNTIFAHDFESPEFFNASDIRGQEGWTGQNGWALSDAGGRGVVASSTTAYQGVTNNQAATPATGETLRFSLDFDIEIGSDNGSSLFRFGVTTLDGSDSFVPALGNNGGSILSGLATYIAGPGTGTVVLWPDEGQSGDTANGVVLDGSAIGLNVQGNDTQTDEIRLTWDAKKSPANGQWEVTLVAENLTSGEQLGSRTVTTSQADVYATNGGLYAGFRGLQNNSQSTFQIDRASYAILTPGSVAAGDYNEDGRVDAADYTVWRDQNGQTGVGLTADGNGDEIVNELDRQLWASNYGRLADFGADTASSAAIAARPVPFSVSQPESAAEASSEPFLLPTSLAGDMSPASERGLVSVRQGLELTQDNALLAYFAELVDPSNEGSDAIESLSDEHEGDSVDEDLLAGSLGSL